MRALVPALLALTLLSGCSEEPAPPPPSCTGVTCTANAHCALVPEPACVCDEGFEFKDGDCVRAAVVDPTSRTKENVCAQWTAGHAVSTPNPWTAGASKCDPGTLARGGISDTVVRVNLFRWLAGLSPVTDDANLNARSQKCAVITAYNPPKAGYNPHKPTAGVECYNAEGATAAGQSNLAWGSGHPAAAIDQFIEDQGSEDTLGHRRWIVHPPLGPIGVGYVEGGAYRNAECLHVFSDKGGGVRPAWYALPNPGFVPVAVTRWPWTFHAANLNPGRVSVSVKRATDGKELAVSFRALPNGYGDPAVSFTPSGWQAVAGEGYDVTVTGFQNEPLTYRVNPVDCP